MLILIIVNAFFVASELALLAARKSRLLTLATKSILPVKFVKKATANLNFYITATQFGSTVASIGVGWEGQLVVEKLLQKTPNIFVSILAFVIITAFLMIFGELIPKKITMRNPEVFSLIILVPLAVFTFLFKPIIKSIHQFTDYVLNLIGKPSQTKDMPYSENELKFILNQAAKEGIVPESLKTIIYNSLRLKKVNAKHIMIDRSKVVLFYADETMREIKNKIMEKKLRFSRYPVFSKEKKQFVGFVEIADLFAAVHEYEPNFSLEKTGIIRKAFHISHLKTVDEILASMLQNQTFVAIIVNERGGTGGVVTITEIIKQLVV